ncbi:Uncharacterized protein TCM_028782 [Theobroma cacao]|uniref:Uncharacterized protein n=1 Tax=Theobroma cacao TaxID=3641 RepID=A0A061GAD7_THECC|nr:Uncharacterized protein TCM_028782 [Theobroma cacao]
MKLGRDTTICLEDILTMGLPKWLLVQTFYSGLFGSIRTTIDVAACRTLMGKSIDEAYDLLEEMTFSIYQWPFERLVLRKVASVHELDSIIALTAQVAGLSKKFDILGVHSI